MHGRPWRWRGIRKCRNGVSPQRFHSHAIITSAEPTPLPPTSFGNQRPLPRGTRHHGSSHLPPPPRCSGGGHPAGHLHGRRGRRQLAAQGATGLKDADALRAKIVQDLVASGIPAKAVVGRTTRCAESTKSTRACRSVAPACRPNARGGCDATVEVEWNSNAASRRSGCPGGVVAGGDVCVGAGPDEQLEQALATLADAGIAKEDVSGVVVRCHGAARDSMACKSTSGRVSRPRWRWRIRITITIRF